METLYRQKGEQNHFLSETRKAHQVLHKGRRGERKKSRHSSRVTMESNNNRTFFAQTKFIVRVPARPECLLWGGQIFFSSRYILFSSFALLRESQTFVDACAACLCAHVLMICTLSAVAVIYCEKTQMQVHLGGPATDARMLGSMETLLSFARAAALNNKQITVQSFATSGQKWSSENVL